MDDHDCAKLHGSSLIVQSESTAVMREVEGGGERRWQQKEAAVDGNGWTKYWYRQCVVVLAAVRRQ